MSNSIGTIFRVTSFGESHGRCMGVVVDGCPAGLRLSTEDVQRELDRRRPGQGSVSTSRAESDRADLLSGIFNGYTTGAPICMLVWNENRDSSDYEAKRWTPRPGHADYTAHIRYGGYNDYRGGGRFSGRITAGFMMAGAVAKNLLSKVLGVEIIAYAKEIGGLRASDLGVDDIRTNAEGNQVRCGDPEVAKRMEELIMKAMAEGDSLGGVVECHALNFPPGVGGPVFDTLEGDLAKALYAIPGAKAVEFGLGREVSRLKGSENNDEYAIKDGQIVTKTNRAGGILGGLSDGMPITCSVAFKPTPSISRRQRTVDIETLEDVTIEVKGRHDPCIVPRAVPVVEGVVAVVLADHAMRVGLIPTVMESMGR